MQAVTSESIEVRAYELWEQEGRPDGRAHEHWFRAVLELANGKSAPANGARKPAKKAAPAVAAAPVAKPKKKAAAAAVVAPAVKPKKKAATTAS